MRGMSLGERSLISAHPSSIRGLSPAALLGIAMPGELLNVVHQAEELPLPIHLGLAPQREAREPLVVADVREDWFHRSKPSRILRTPLGRIDARFHAGRLRRRRLGRPTMEERDLAGRRRLGMPQALGSLRAGQTILFRAAKVIRHVALGHDVVARACLLYTSPSPRDREKSR